MFKKTQSVSALPGRKTAALAAAIFLSPLSGCGERSAEGQAVAVVNGEPITETELNLELSAVPEAQRAEHRQDALDALIDRKLLVAEAKEQDLHQRPEFTLESARRADTLLADIYLRETLSGRTQPPTEAQINSYLEERPFLHEGRTLYTLQQVAFASPEPELRKKIEGTQTFPELLATLDAAGVEYARGTGNVDTATAADALVVALQKLKPGEPLINYQNGQVVAGVVVSREPKPVSNADAAVIARSRLEKVHSAEMVEQQLEALRAKAKIEVAEQKEKADAPTAG